MMATSNSTLPSQKAVWRQLVEQHGLTSETLYSIETASGSQIELRQFLLLRVLYVTKKEANDLLGACIPPTGVGPLISKPNWRKADKFLNGLESWKMYQKSLGSSHTQEGAFSLVQYYQHLTTRNPEHMEGPAPKVLFSPKPKRKTKNVYAHGRSEQDSPTPGPRNDAESSTSAMMDQFASLDFSTPEPGPPPEASFLSPWSPMFGDAAKVFKAIEDEQIVNTALVLFLNALTINCPDIKSEWTLYRCPFIFKDSKGTKVYEARVDGLLRTKNKRDHDHTQALIEVKPFLRNTSVDVADAIRMQEAAQMVAWISQYPPSPNKTGDYRRFLISQDRNEIYVTIGSFNDQYTKYIGEEHSSEDSFLTMTEYGPFDVSEAHHMRFLGKIMLAFSLQGGVE